jgi:hypothetical protein
MNRPTRTLSASIIMARVYPRSPFIGFFLSFVVSALCAPLRLATVRPMHTHFRPTLLVALVILAGAPLAGAPSQHHQHRAAPPPVSAAAAQQIQDVRQAASTLATPDGARAAGYEPVLGWIPMMGTHWVHGPRMLQGKPAVTRTTPSQLMFSRVDGRDTLVGVAYAYYADVKDTAQPVLFDGAPAWHDHPDLAPPGTNLVMLHTWFVESPDGPFAAMNPFLPYWAAGVTPPAVARMQDAAFGMRVRKGALALAEIVEEAGLFPILARRPAVRPVLEERRAAIRALVPQLNSARALADQAAWDALIDALGSHFDAMREAYLASALDPALRARIAKGLDDMIHGGH